MATSIECAETARALRTISFHSGGDEHGVLRGVPPGLLPVGATVQLIPSHCDPTVNLHDAFVVIDDREGGDGFAIAGVEGGEGGGGWRVHDVWPIDARGYGIG